MPRDDDVKGHVDRITRVQRRARGKICYLRLFFVRQEAAVGDGESGERDGRPGRDRRSDGGRWSDSADGGREDRETEALDREGEGDGRDVTPHHQRAGGDLQLRHHR